jgi:hypothetical protein
MLVGATAYTAFGTFTQWNSVNPFDAMLRTNQSIIPTWFVVLFLVVAIIQLFGINALDLYSSGVSLQALGLRLKRYQAVLVDGVIAGLLTVWVTFGSTFSLFMKEFVGVVIVWIAPWFGIFITDWLLRRREYDGVALQDTSKNSRYYGSFGVNWNAVSAFVVGVVAATSAYSKAPPPVTFPAHWMTPISNHFGSFYDQTLNGWWGGADFSIPLGIGCAALTYWLLEIWNRSIGRQRETHAAAPVTSARLRAFGLFIVVVGFGVLVSALALFTQLDYQRDATLQSIVATTLTLIGSALVAVGVKTVRGRTDRLRDLSTTLSVGLVALGLIVAAIPTKAVHQESWAIGIVASGLVTLIARALLPRGPQNTY